MDAEVSILVGKVIKDIVKSEENDELIFICEDDETYRMFHRSECCEEVEMNDICGDLQDLIGSKILQAEETTSKDNPKDNTINEYQCSFTWTFYRISSFNGSVTIRWYGISNGYYSEGVSFERVLFN